MRLISTLHRSAINRISLRVRWLLTHVQYCEDHQLDPETAVTQLRGEVFEKTKITISAGIAPNARIAKIASNKNKPNGQFMIANERTTVMKFMRDLPVRKVNGVGRVFERELDAVGIKTCGDIFPHRAYLARLFGDKAFFYLLNCYLGLGRTKIQPAEDYERKSVGTESTFHDMSGQEELRTKLRSTAEELEKDLVRTQFKGRTLVLKVKLHTYEVLTRQVVLPKAVHLADDLYAFALPMLSKLEIEIPGMRLRLMGLRVTQLVSMKKDNLDFFGVKSLSSDAHRGYGIKRKVGVLEEDWTEWEVWPETELEGVPCSDHPPTEEGPQNSSEDCTEEQLKERNRRRKHGKEIVPNPNKEASLPRDELWPCPICFRPQTANDKQFNDHIDFCLSRQTIKEAVKDSATPAPGQQKRGPFLEPSRASNILATRVGIGETGQRKL